MKLVDDSKNWSKWWSIRLSIVGGALLTFLELFPHALSTYFGLLPAEITQAVPDSVFKVIGILCVIASPIARVIKQFPDTDNKADKE